MSNMVSETANLHLPRIICLHGGGSNARIFRAQCRAILGQLKSSFRFCFVDAPFLSEPGPDVVPTYQNYGPFRRWLRFRPDHPELDNNTAAQSIIHSIKTAMKHDDMLGGTGGWIGLLGFSQGAKIAASLILQQSSLDHDQQWDFRFAILLAGSAPLVSLSPQFSTSPYLADASQISTLTTPSIPDTEAKGEHRVRTATVHVHGLQDAGRHRHQLLLEQYCHGESARLVEWEGGHRVPIKKRDVTAVVQMILEVASEASATRC